MYLFKVYIFSISNKIFNHKISLDGRSVFTKKLYPSVFKQTGIHFFNIPCQAASWYPRMSCPIPTNSNQCKVRQCTSRERQVDELKCNTPTCDGQEICIPVYYTPRDLKPQVGLYRFK
jgi:hypothetical protein